MLPIAGSRDQPMSYRIDMDVVDVSLPIRVIADHMLPIAALPNVTLALVMPGLALHSGSIRQSKTFRKACFYEPDARGVVGVIFRHGPNHMDMIGQDYLGHVDKRTCAFDLGEGAMPKLDV